ncbi:hypothetical protein [Actinopolyspora mortivallis]|uniref:hypothetical protein n=1 Tax=Actinopolyspora mortivallis TaxID=33906 RepID=UPI000375293F|nr:hypothetical protein [Actinopolyspora mortivallis]
MSELAAVVATASTLFAVAVVLAVSGQRAGRSPRHARQEGGSGPAARRLALAHLGQLAMEGAPTGELISWPTVDPDRHGPSHSTGIREQDTVLPAAGEDPTLALLCRVRDGLRRL